MPKYLVAFSLAGEQRAFVRSIATEVRRELGEGRVFLDEWFEHLLAGHDADVKLQKIYGEDCELAILCVSGHYGNKPWTLAEHEAIRARYMQTRASADEREQLRVMPIRVGDGDVRGILFTTIVPDVRNRTPREAAELIVRRLRAITGDAAPAAAGSGDSWPDAAPPLRWPIADHSSVREAFGRLLTRTSPWRCLLLRGASETGKSHITRQMLRNGLQIQGLDCGRFDLKGTTDIDAAVRIFVQHLNVSEHSSVARFSERLGAILAELRKRATPALLIFDTYEAASSEAQEWVEKELLPSLVRATWLRVVIAGQRVPERAGALWEPEAAPVMDLRPPHAEDWFAYAREHGKDVTLPLVESVVKLAPTKTTVLAHLFGPAS